MIRVATATVFVLVVGTHPPARAGFVGVAGGPGDHSPTLGPYTLTPFTDTPANRAVVSSLDSPLGGTLGFGQTMEALSATVIGQWSGTPANSYTGDIYAPYQIWTGSLTLTLPADTVAFSLYVEPNAYALAESITVKVQDGTSVTQTVQSNITGAKYYGFYATGSDRITSLTISEPGGNEVLIGNFGIASAGPEVAAVPAPAGFVLLGTAAPVLAALTRRRLRRSVA